MPYIRLCRGLLLNSPLSLLVERERPCGSMTCTWLCSISFSQAPTARIPPSQRSIGISVAASSTCRLVVPECIKAQSHGVTTVHPSLIWSRNRVIAVHGNAARIAGEKGRLHRNRETAAASQKPLFHRYERLVDIFRRVTLSQASRGSPVPSRDVDLVSDKCGRRPVLSPADGCDVPIHQGKTTPGSEPDRS